MSATIYPYKTPNCTATAAATIREDIAKSATQFSLSSDEEKKRLELLTSCLDLTTLKGDDTANRVKRLCETAKKPLESKDGIQCAAVCVYDAFITAAKKETATSKVKVATVSAGFPAGLSPLNARLAEIKASVKKEVDEIDVVIPRHLALEGNWEALYQEIRAFREQCGDTHMKVILATGELAEIELVYCASRVAMQAGADFIKTSTGMESINATLEAGATMTMAIRDHFRETNARVGLKPAGGIRDYATALAWYELVKNGLGEEWLHPNLFRIGASSLLTSIQERFTALHSE